MAVILLPVGSLRQRHIDGLKFISLCFPARKVYILYDVDKRFSEGELSVKTNAEAVASACSMFNPKILEWDPTSSENIAMVFTRILQDEGIQLSNSNKEDREDVLVDISSTPKPVMVVSTLFAVLFGLKVYYVQGKKSFNVWKRAERMINKLFKPGAKTKAEIASALLESDKNLEERLEKIRNSLIRGAAHATYNLCAQSPAGPHPLEVIPSLGEVGVEFKKEDELILVTILEAKDTIVSIRKLHDQLRDEIQLSTLTYRILKLSNWGLVQTTGRKAKRLDLTPIGRGIARGLQYNLRQTLDMPLVSPK